MAPTATKGRQYPKPVRLNCSQVGHPAKSKLVPTGRIQIALMQHEQQGVRPVVIVRHSDIHRNIQLLRYICQEF